MGRPVLGYSRLCEIYLALKDAPFKENLMEKTRCGFLALAALVFGLLTAGACLCLAQGTDESSRSAPMTVGKKSLPGEVRGPLRRVGAWSLKTGPLTVLRTEFSCRQSWKTCNSTNKSWNSTSRSRSCTISNDESNTSGKRTWRSSMKKCRRSATKGRACKRNTDGRISSLKKRLWNLMQKSKN